MAVRVALLRPPPLARPYCGGCIVRHDRRRGASDLRLWFAASPPAVGDWISLRGPIVTASGRWPAMLVTEARPNHRRIVRVPDDTIEIGYADHPNRSDPLDQSPLAWAPLALSPLESPAATADGGLEGVLPEAADVVVGDHWNVDGVTWSDGGIHLLEVAALAGRVTLRPVAAGVRVTSVGAGGVRWARVGVLRRRRFRVTSIEPAAGIHGPRTVAVSGHDLMGELAAAHIDPQPAAGLRGDEVVRAVLAAAPVHEDRLLDVAADRGAELAWALTTGGGSALKLLAAATRSAWGRCYLRGDGRSGERLVWESRERRQRAPAAIFTPARWTRAEVKRETDDVVGARIGVTRRAADAAPSVLCDLDEPIPIGPGQTIDVTLPFRAGAAAGAVAGADLEVPRPDTHFRAAAAGGADRTGNLVVALAPGSTAAHWHIVNQGADAVRLTRLRAVGRAIRSSERQHVEARDETPAAPASTPWWTLDAPLRSGLDRTARLGYHQPGRNARGRSVTVDLEWQDSAAVAADLAAVLVRPRGAPYRIVSFSAAVSTAADERLVTALDVGSAVVLDEGLTGAGGLHFVAALAVEREGGATRVRCYLEPAVDVAAWVLDDPEQSALDTSTAIGY